MAAWIDDGQKVVSWTLCRRTPPFSRSKLAWYGYSALHHMRRRLCRPRPPAHVSFPSPVPHSPPPPPPPPPPASRTKGGNPPPTRTRRTTKDRPALPEPAYHRIVGRSCKFNEAIELSRPPPSVTPSSWTRGSFSFGIGRWLLRLCVGFRHLVALAGRAEDTLVDWEYRVACWTGASRGAVDQVVCTVYGLLAGCMLLKLTFRSVSLPSWRDVLLFDEPKPEPWKMERWILYTFGIRVKAHCSPSRPNVEFRQTLRLEGPIQCRRDLEVDAWYRLDAAIRSIKADVRRYYGPIVETEVKIKKDWILCDAYSTKFGKFSMEVKREGFDGAEWFASERHFMLNMPDHVSLDDEWEVMLDAQYDLRSRASSAILPYDPRPQPELPMPRVLAPEDMRDEWREGRDDMRWRPGAIPLRSTRWFERLVRRHLPSSSGIERDMGIPSVLANEGLEMESAEMLMERGALVARYLALFLSFFLSSFFLLSLILSGFGAGVGYARIRLDGRWGRLRQLAQSSNRYLKLKPKVSGVGGHPGGLPESRGRRTDGSAAYRQCRRRRRQLRHKAGT
ncbi:hypothetical protein FRC09_001293 [Ceratobasidium sp. 395]|nr:hypothetical protein FRC09_001293 [Ceratobasidium sp. 395]